MPGWAKALLIIIGIFVVLGVLVGGCAIVFANRASNALNNAFGTAKVSDYDVTLSDCSLDGSSPSAEGTLTNTSKKRQGFQVEVEFFDGKKTLLGTGTDFVGAIDVGASATWSASAFETTQAAQIECQVARVSYSFLGR